VGSSGWKFLLLLGWTSETKTKKTQKASHRYPKRREDEGGRQTQSMCVGKGDRVRGLESQRQKQPRRITVRGQVQGQSHKTQTLTEGECHRQIPGERDTQTDLEVGGKSAGALGKEGGTQGPGGGLGPLGCCRLPGPCGAHSEGLCGLPHRGGPGRALRGPGAPWPHTDRPGCGKVDPSRPVAPTGLGRRRPRCPSPGS
jgi:hypothetical protein